MKKIVIKLAMMFAICFVSAALHAQTPYTLVVPQVVPGSITIDGQLSEYSWLDTMGTLNFGVGGLGAGFANELDYTIWGNASYAHSTTQTIKMRHDGAGKLYVAMISHDADIQGNDGTSTAWWNFQDSDGMGSFVVLRKGTPDTYDGTTLTFFPPATNPADTLLTPGLSGTYHYGTARGTTWDWSFLPGNNTVNNISDTDTGFIIEFVIDLTTSGYTASDTDVVVGIMTANHDGPISDGYPWGNSAFSRFQWSNGSYAANYGIDHLTLDPTLATPVELSAFTTE